MKYIVVIIGCFCLALVMVIEKLGGVLDISLSFYGMTAGPLLGLFTLGMIFRSANSKVHQTFLNIIKFIYRYWVPIPPEATLFVEILSRFIIKFIIQIESLIVYT